MWWERLGSRREKELGMSQSTRPERMNDCGGSNRFDGSPDDQTGIIYCSVYSVRLRLQPQGVHRDHAVGVFLASLCTGVGELQGHERLRGRVAVLQSLKDRPAERVLRAFFGHVREELVVALDDEPGQPALE